MKIKFTTYQSAVAFYAMYLQASNAYAEGYVQGSIKSGRVVIEPRKPRVKKQMLPVAARAPRITRSFMG